MIVRLTTNHPDSLKDNTYAGDRTLVTTIHNDKILFYSYFLLDPPNFE